MTAAVEKKDAAPSMRVTETQVTKLTIAGAKNLDTVHAILEDTGAGAGKLTLECFGDAWSHYWSSMGPRTAREFVLKAGDEYLASKLCRQPERVTDWEAISTKVGQPIHSEIDAEDNDELMEEHYGADWRAELPQTQSRDWHYVRRIVQALKQGLALRHALQQDAPAPLVTLDALPDEIHLLRAMCKACVEIDKWAHANADKKALEHYPIRAAMIEDLRRIGEQPYISARVGQALASAYLHQGAAARTDVPDDIHLLRLVCEIWNDVDKWAYKHAGVHAIAKYPVVQGTTNQMTLRNLGAMPYAPSAVKRSLDMLGRRPDTGAPDQDPQPAP